MAHDLLSLLISDHILELLSLHIEPQPPERKDKFTCIQHELTSMTMTQMHVERGLFRDAPDLTKRRGGSNHIETNGHGPYSVLRTLSFDQFRVRRK